jgi:hypothetical protein
MNLKSLLLTATAVLALTGAGHATLYKCQCADGKVVLRDRHCPAGEREVEEVRSSEVPRQFTMMNALPAEAPADPAGKKSATNANSTAKP